MQAAFPSAGYLVFGWGARDYYMARNPDIGDILRAVASGPAVMLGGYVEVAASQQTGDPRNRQLMAAGLSLDNLVGAGEDFGRDRETERLPSVEVHCQFEFAGWLNGHSSGLRTLEDPVDKTCGTAEQVLVIGGERHQSPFGGKNTKGVDCRQSRFRGQRDDSSALGRAKRAGSRINGFAAFAAQPRKGKFEGLPSRRLEHQGLDALSPSLASDVLPLLVEAGITPDDNCEPMQTRDELSQQLQPFGNHFGRGQT